MLLLMIRIIMIILLLVLLLLLLTTNESNNCNNYDNTIDPSALHSQFSQYKNDYPEHLLEILYLKGTIENDLLNDQKI